MNNTISRDYCLIIANLSMNADFADAFFADPEYVISEYDISEFERESLLNISRERYELYKETQNRSKDCDACCNGSSNCFAACCA